MRFDGPTLARAWLAVAQASATKDDAAALDKTIAIEDHLTGVRVVATDRFMLLTAWVPRLGVPGWEAAPEPDLSTLPDRTVIVRDGDKRGRSLLGYVLTLAKRDKDDDAPGAIEVDVTFDARLPAGADPQGSLDGMDPTYVVLSVPDREKVWLPVVAAAYPDWRPLVLGHDAVETKAVSFRPDLLARAAAVAKWADGPLTWVFGGTDQAALVDYSESDPHVSGVAMPVRMFVDGDAPGDVDD